MKSEITFNPNVMLSEPARKKLLNVIEKFDMKDNKEYISVHDLKPGMTFLWPESEKVELKKHFAEWVHPILDARWMLKCLPDAEHASDYFPNIRGNLWVVGSRGAMLIVACFDMVMSVEKWHWRQPDDKTV